MKFLIITFILLLSSFQSTLAVVQQVNEPTIYVFSLDYEYGPYSSEYGNGNGYGQSSTNTSNVDETLLNEVDRILAGDFSERPTQKDISKFIEQLEMKLNSGETLQSYSSYSLDKILNVVRANNEKGKGALKEDLNSLKIEIENELSSSTETSKDFAEIHNQEIKDYIASLPFLAQAVQEPNFKNASSEIRKATFYAGYVSQTVKEENKFLKEAADRALQRADELDQSGNKEASEKALTQAYHLLDNALAPNSVPNKSWKSSGEEKEKLNDLHQKISKVRPPSEDEALGKNIAAAALVEADEASANGDRDLYEKNLEIAKAGLDIALGFIPVASLGQSLYEAITGRSVITGEELGTFGQTMAILGVATLGTSKTFQSSLKTLGKIGQAVLKTPSGLSKFNSAFSLCSRLVEFAAKLGFKAKDELTEVASTFKTIISNSRGSSDLHIPIVEYFDSIAETVGKEGYDLVKGIPGLRYTGEGTWVSQAGIIYGKGSKDGNRLRHILLHRKPDPLKPKHNVFAGETKDIPSLIDEAWLKKGIPEVNDPGAYVVPMGKVIGTQGETSLRIIVKPGTCEIISAYPQ